MAKPAFVAMVKWVVVNCTLYKEKNIDKVFYFPFSSEIYIYVDR